ncbi:unnamed protein product [Leptidea sinapis]|uniref:Dipeptidylpeptidase IV N-terminal domain-containing protein n=2 Tax=Leptidea sinapis TaxID=189913 RepID=A0A5E4PSQ5_9NEOP|nr:unnamed protein product [Leptidea sinapis]
MASHLNIVGLSNKGLFQLNFEEPYEEKQLRDGATQNIRSVVVSPKGNYLAYRTDKKVEIIKCIDWTLAAAIDGNVRDMFFSPMDTYLTVWEMFLITKDHPQGQPNLHVYSSSSGELVGSFVQKNQSGWHPKWSSDEKLFTIQSNSKILIYEDAKFDRYTHNVQAQNLQAFSVSPSVAPNYYLSVFTLG